MKNKVLYILLFVLICTAFLFGCQEAPYVPDSLGSDAPGPLNNEASVNDAGLTEEGTIEENSSYSSPEDVSEYLHTYGKLPPNFITKKEAQALGWESEKGNLWDVTDKMSIGGDVFGNREKKLPASPGRKWHECDVNYNGGYRGAERIVYSDDGLIYYSPDHYNTFLQLY